MPRGIFPRPVRSVIHVIGPSIAYVPLTRGLFALIEADDAPLVESRNWTAQYHRSSGKYYAFTWAGNNTWDYMHRVLRESSHGVDHKNGDGLDNRREGNLRAASQTQNMANTKKRSDNTTGFKGVSRKRRGFFGRLTHAGKTHYVGYFANAEDAYAAVCAKSRDLNGEFARFK
jgi:hypothetical protein